MSVIEHMKLKHKLRLSLLFLLLLAWFAVSVAAQHEPGTEIVAAVWSPNGDKIAGAGLDGLLRIWDAETGAILQDFSGIGRAVTTVAWSPDGTRIASGGGDNTVRIWDVEGPLLATIDGHMANIMSVAWSPDGSLLASATHTGADPYSLRIWDGNSYQPLFEQDSGNINSVAWNPDPSRSELAIANENRYVSIRPITPTGIPSSRLAYQGNAPMFSVAWNSDGSRLASADVEGQIDIWDTTNFNNIRTFIGHTDLVGALVWSPDDTQLASASSDGTIRVWDVATGQTVNIFQNPKQTFTTSIDWNNTGLIFGRADTSVGMIRFPTANAGSDQTVTDSDNSGSELVTLDGSGSTDSDGTIVSYSWVENGVEIATGVSPQVDLAVGVHTIILTVTDDDDASDTDDVVITVEAPPSALMGTVTESTS